MRSQGDRRVRHGDAGRAAEAIRADGSVRRAMHRRVLTVVIAGQVLGGAGLAAGVTVGALLAQQMLGSDAVSGLRLRVDYVDQHRRTDPADRGARYVAKLGVELPGVLVSVRMTAITS